MDPYLNELNKTPEGRTLIAVMLRDADAILAIRPRIARLEAAAARALMERDSERVNRYMIAADALREVLSEEYLGCDSPETYWNEDASIRMSDARRE